MSMPSSPMNRSAASRSDGLSPTIEMCETSTPRPASSVEIHGPFLSWIVPVITSVPVTTIPARTGFEDASLTAPTLRSYGATSIPSGLLRLVVSGVRAPVFRFTVLTPPELKPARVT